MPFPINFLRAGQRQPARHDAARPGAGQPPAPAGNPGNVANPPGTHPGLLRRGGPQRRLMQAELLAQSRTQMQAEWIAWAEEDGIGEERAQRQRAVVLMRRALESETVPHSLNLVDMGLTSLPPRLPNTSALSLSRNHLTQLPAQLPSTLNRLYVHNNQLTHLPDPLPVSLIELHADDNQLTHLPEPLPRYLRELYLRDNRLTHLPERLPNDLRALVVSRNQLTHLPAVLPRSLTMIELNHNALTRLPAFSPSFLTLLHISGNALTELPRCIPRNVTINGSFSFNGNPLPQAVVDRVLTECRARSITVSETPNPAVAHRPPRHPAPEALVGPAGPMNELTDQPQLPARGDGPPPAAQVPARPAQVDTELSAELQDLMRRYEALVQGDEEADQRTRLVAELTQAVIAWATPTTTTNIAATLRLWRGFSDEPGAQAFAQFLNRLRETVNYRNPQFQASVAHWLAQLENREQLRRDTFAASVGVTESCQDRISLTFNGLRKLHLASDVARGDYDRRLPDLLTLARGMFRLDQLETIANEHTSALERTHGRDHVDPIEVFLAYQVRLREPLALPVETTDMAYFSMSRVTQPDLDRAQTRVLAAERTELVNYLATQFEPWQSVLQRLAPEQHAQTQDELIEAMGDEFTRRLNARLQEMGLENDADAQRTLGPQVQAEITREINGRLTRNFLASRGLLNHLMPPSSSALPPSSSSPPPSHDRSTE